MSSDDQNETVALTKIIDVLRPLPSEERHRAVGAAMLFLGETMPSHLAKQASVQAEADTDHSSVPSAATKWMKQYNVSAEELEHVFHFDETGGFDLLTVPGGSKKEQTLNTYLLTGLGTYLASGSRHFGDATARAFCEKTGCYDPANHATHMRKHGVNLSGDKTKGFSLTTAGMKSGAALVKAVASAPK